MVIKQIYDDDRMRFHIQYGTFNEFDLGIVAKNESYYLADTVYVFGGTDSKYPGMAATAFGWTPVTETDGRYQVEGAQGLNTHSTSTREVSEMLKELFADLEPKVSLLGFF